MADEFKCCGKLKECDTSEKGWLGEGIFVCPHFDSEDFTCEIKKNG